MCATSGGGFALMTEALGAAAMMEVPLVCIDVQRAGPATGVPTKTEQGDLWQALGAGQGDYPRIIVAPTTIPDCFEVIPELFNLVDRFQCPGIVLTDLLISEGRSSVDPDELDFDVPINRGDVIGLNGHTPDLNGSAYKRYEFTESGVSPRAIPGTPGFVHVVATDEHDEEGGLISDEFTNPHKRQAMHEKRMHKMDSVASAIAPPALFGPAEAEVTLVGWGSTEGVIREAIELLAHDNIVANNLQIKWLVPLHAEAIMATLSKATKVIIVENNYSGQFARYLRSETSFVPSGHIRKYDGEPFMPHHIVEGVKRLLSGTTTKYVPVHEMLV
jgi:2-oxoglutarate/2-oxoacid ferredoxin oxidoreductase subunit alpha